MRGSLDTEVIVCGAGPVGAATAALLEAAGVSCMLIDGRREVAAVTPDWDPRALALSPASRSILESFGAWSRVPAERTGRFRRMRVWDEAGRGVIGFDSAELCAPVLGYIVEQPVLQAALDKHVAATRGIVLRRGVEAIAIDWFEDRVGLRLDDGTRYAASLLVAADGSDSPLRTLAGIRCPARDYGQHALACVVRTERGHEDTARQRFLRHGPLAFLPLAAPDRCGIVWSTTPAHARTLLDMSDAAFAESLGQAFGHALGEVLEVAPRRSFPLHGAQAEHYCRGRMVLVGDAAHCVHPLAGQGVNLGLLDAAALVQVLAEERGRGRDVGAMRGLRRYERWRRGEDGAMVLLLEGMKRLFENRSGAVAALRNAGLDLVDRSGPAKHALMRRAMGIAGDVPELARAAG